VLSIEGLTVSYGGIIAVRDVALDVTQGSIMAIVGPNGAGKTTLLNAISGIVPSHSGSIRFAGEDITAWPAHVIARAGLVQVPEGRRILGPMTVLENLEVGRQAAGQRGTLAAGLEQAFALFPILAERRNQRAGSLSGGQQQMLAIARAIMACPRLLLLDEPSLGLSPLITSEVFKALAALNAEGLTILVVEQNARRALAASSYAFVLERGRIVHRGESAALANDPVIIDHYLGRA
jgi:branched-chain amino acid transport system ATP-binding protein